MRLASSLGAISASESGGGAAFSTGIGYGVTGAYADNDTTAISAGQVFLFLGYA